MKKEFITPEIDCSLLVPVDCIMGSSELITNKGLFTRVVDNSTLDVDMYKGEDAWI